MFRIKVRQVDLTSHYRVVDVVKAELVSDFVRGNEVIDGVEKTA